MPQTPQTNDNWSKFRKSWSDSTLPRETTPVVVDALFSQTMSANNMMAALIDMKNMKYLYWSGNTPVFTGWPDNHFREGGVQFGFSIMHPDDLPGVIAFAELMNNFYKSLSEEDRALYRDYLDYRTVRQDNTYRRALQRGTVVEHDEDGKISVVLILISNISYQKNNKSMHLRQTTGKVDMLFEYNLQEKKVSQISPLSQRELEVFQFISQGYERAEVAGQLGISLSTVKTHCHNAFNKLKTTDAIETINLLKVLGYLG